MKSYPVSAPLILEDGVDSREVLCPDSICPASPLLADLSTIVASLARLLPSTASIADRLTLGCHEDDLQGLTFDL